MRAMSFVRTAFVLSAVIALLPSDKGKQQQLYAQAMAAAHDAATYCDRNTETCVKAAEYWEQFKGKAAFAGELALEALQRYQVHTETATAEAPVKAAPASSRHGTLIEKDFAPSWRGSSRQGI